MPEETFTTTSSDLYMETTKRPPGFWFKLIDKLPIVIGIIVVLVIIVLFGLLGWWLFVNPEATAVLRDIFIVFLGVGVFVIILLLLILIVIMVYVALKINDLIYLLNHKIRVALDQIQETANTVKGTTTLVSEQIVKPVITTASAVAGVQAIFKSLFRWKK